MIVVSDTGPLNYLTIIDIIDVLPVLYEKVAVPPAVEAELSRPSTPEKVRTLMAKPPPWLTMVPSPPDDHTLDALHDGEREANFVALSLKADVLLCDDAQARAAATARNMKVIGTLGVIQAAAIRELLNLNRTLDALMRTNFRASKAIIERIRKQGGD